MEQEIKIIGTRKAPPLTRVILSIVLTTICVAFVALLYFATGDTTMLPLIIVFFVLCFFLLFLNILMLITKIKTKKNKLPFAKIDPNDECIEFYSVLATSLKIKKDKIYMIKVTGDGEVSIFFKSDIDQNLMFNSGFFYDAKECKAIIKGYLKQEIK